jgi:hypothetical protein
MFEVFGQRESGRVTLAWILLEALQANGGELAIYLRIQRTWWPRLGIEK